MQHENEDSPNRLSTIPEEDSQASYLVNPEQGPPDEIEIDTELWHQLDINVKSYLLEHANVDYQSAGKFDECEYHYDYNSSSADLIGTYPDEGRWQLSNPDYNCSSADLNLAQNFLSTGANPEQFGYGEPDVDEN